MAGGNEYRRRRNEDLAGKQQKKDPTEELPYYMRSQRATRERDLDTERKYQNEQMNAKIYADKVNEIQDRKPKTPLQQRNRNRADLKEEGADRAEIARHRKQRQIADQLLNNRRRKSRTGGER